MRDAQGQWIVDPEFIPPLLSLAASPTLVSELGELLHRLQARRRRLMAMRRESNARMADFAVADVSLFWLLNALNSAEPVLSELHQGPFAPSGAALSRTGQAGRQSADFLP